jgi:hypothetical protein
MDQVCIHITRNGKILCHAYEAGLMLTINFQEASGMNPELLCTDCCSRHRNICTMIGAIPPLAKEIRIGSAEKKMILSQIKESKSYKDEFTITNT